MISLITGAYTTVTPIIDHAKTFLVVLWTEQATSRFTRNISLKFHYSRTWWIPLKLYGFQGWHKDVSLGQQITKTIVINVGSIERDNEETTGSFDNGVSFEVDD